MIRNPIVFLVKSLSKNPEIPLNPHEIPIQIDHWPRLRHGSCHVAPPGRGQVRDLGPDRGRPAVTRSRELRAVEIGVNLRITRKCMKICWILICFDHQELRVVRKNLGVRIVKVKY